MQRDLSNTTAVTWPLYSRSEQNCWLNGWGFSVILEFERSCTPLFAAIAGRTDTRAVGPRRDMCAVTEPACIQEQDQELWHHAVCVKSLGLMNQDADLC